MRKEKDKSHRFEKNQFSSLLTPSLPKEFILKHVADSALDPHLVSYFYPKSPISEQYRRLRENVKTLAKTNGLQTLVVTSSIMGEGKSITALNLAISMAKDVDCKKVVVIDADLRRGKVDKLLGFDGKVGLSEYLSIGAEMDNIIYKTPVDSLHIIPCGKMVENPTELLASQKMKQLLAELKGEFPYIILDTTPLIPVADAGILCGIADAALLVVRFGSTKRGLVDHAREILDQSKGKLAGYVFTQLEYHIPEYIYKYV